MKDLTFDLSANSLNVEIIEIEEEAYSDQSLVFQTVNTKLELLVSDEQVGSLLLKLVDHAVENELLSSMDMDSIGFRMGAGCQDRGMVETLANSTDRELVRL